MKIIKKLFLFAIVSIILFSCNSNPLKVNLKGVEKPEINIKRYEVDMFNIPSEKFIGEVQKLQSEYPVFLGGDINDTAAILYLKSFFEDKYIIELFDASQLSFADLSFLESELEKAFQYYKFYYPNSSTPKVYSYISGLDAKFPIKFAENELLISLDLYLGRKQEIYNKSGIPEFKSNYYIKEAIAPDCFAEISHSYIPDLNQSSNLLEQMIQKGKELYFINAMLPDIQDSVLMKYTSKQMEWCDDYENKLWTFIVENNFLFESNMQVSKKFMNDGPFTSIFTKTSPSRLGHFIGWKIVSAYMQNNNVSINEMLIEKDANKILQKSKYRPKS